jgi:SAM-dependent methyltransferase
MVDPDLDLGVGTYDMAACMFAAHYACESDETLACFFENVAAHLREGGVCVCVFPDYYAVEQHLRAGVPIPGVAVEGWTFGARGTGHRYTFRMEGCVACPEFQVHPDTWSRAASDQNLEILQRKNLTAVLRDGLRRAPQLATDMRVRPEHLSGDLRLTQLYCSCILRKRRARKRARVDRSHPVP